MPRPALLCALLAGPAALAQDVPPVPEGREVPHPVVEAEAAYRRGDWAEMARLLEPLAEKGDARAQNLLGLALSRGPGKDYQKALNLFDRSAKAGDVNALVNLGRMHHLGLGFKGPDPRQAETIYEIAAEKGHPVALYNLGLLHLFDKGTPEDTDRALDLFRQAAEAGFLPAFTMTGSILKSRPGADAEHGREILEKAYGLGDPAAAYSLHWYHLRLSQRLALNDARAAERQSKEALQWLERAAQAGHADAQALLVDQHIWAADKAEILAAVRWAAAAAQNGYPAGIAKSDIENLVLSKAISREEMEAAWAAGTALAKGKPSRRRWGESFSPEPAF